HPPVSLPTPPPFPTRRSSDLELAKLLAVLVVHHQDRTDQVWAGLTTGRVAAVAKATLSDKQQLSTLHGGLIETGAASAAASSSSLGCGRIACRRLVGPDQCR